MNILTQKFNTKYETAPFQEIKEENYLPAFQELITQSEKEILKQATEKKQKHSTEEIEKIIAEKQKEMETAAKNLDFITAARLRDEIKALQE